MNSICITRICWDCACGKKIMHDAYIPVPVQDYSSFLHRSRLRQYIWEENYLLDNGRDATSPDESRVRSLGKAGQPAYRIHWSKNVVLCLDGQEERRWALQIRILNKERPLFRADSTQMLPLRKRYSFTLIIPVPSKLKSPCPPLDLSFTHTCALLDEVVSHYSSEAALK